MATSQLPCPAPRTGPSGSFPGGSVPGGSVPEGQHNSQQSHDSGTYLDWAPERESPPPPPPPGPGGDFVTVVSVEGAAAGGVVAPVPLERMTPFVTVLSIGPAAGPSGPGAQQAPPQVAAVVHVEGRSRPLPDGAEEVSVYRLPGERLGFGLKFEGGAGALGGPGDAVRRLLIQSCAPESPASRALCSWGPLGEGDEILEIDQVPVNTLTKAECVHAMKESKVVMRLVVRGNGRGRPGPGPVVCGELKKAATAAAAAAASPPPPIPPRKGRSSSGGSAPPSPPGPGPGPVADSIGPPNVFADADISHSGSLSLSSADVEHEKQPLSRTSSASSAASSASRLASKRTSPLTPRAGKRNSLNLAGAPLPPDAEVYLDLVSLERGQSHGHADSESDDTNSSLSTVVALPSTSNSSLSADMSSPTTPGPGAPPRPIDLARLLGPFERLERELASEPGVQDGAGPGPALATSTPTATPSAAAAAEPAFVFPELQPPPSFQDAPLSYGNEEVRPQVLERPPEEVLEHALLVHDREVSGTVPGRRPRAPPHSGSHGLFKPPDVFSQQVHDDAELSDAAGDQSGRNKKKRAPPPPPPRGRPQPQAPPPQAPQPAPRGDRLPRLVHCVPKEAVVAAAPRGPSPSLVTPASPPPPAARTTARPTPPEADVIPEPLERLIERQHLLDLITPSSKAPAVVGESDRDADTKTEQAEVEDVHTPPTVEISEVTEEDDDVDGEVTLRLPDLVMDSQQLDGDAKFGDDEDGDGLEDGEDFASYRRSLSSPLPTIGEDEEEAEQRGEAAR
ncbi:PDZ domain-containing protein 2 [Frankliniella fusca]|uniref:PDZ domain-containing protein 2 n=1 Tax=Frankliniella fusca TaxID=407009 RepID=A0AAE1HMA4_9NEOP|nr:PDZ domain-containing protein 2 [Frankliniella fusca]